MNTGFLVDAVKVHRLLSDPQRHDEFLDGAGFAVRNGDARADPRAAGSLPCKHRIQGGLLVLEQAVFGENIHQLRDHRVFIRAGQGDLNARGLQYSS